MERVGCVDIFALPSSGLHYRLVDMRDPGRSWRNKPRFGPGLFLVAAALASCAKTTNGPRGVTGGSQSIAATDSSTCAIGLSGAAYCWGGDHQGELGIADTIHCRAPSVGGGCIGGDSHTTPAPVASGLTFFTLSGGGYNVCALSTSRATWCWGHQLSDSGHYHPSPTAVTTPQFAVVSTGAVHSCGLTEAGTAYCWGANDEGQLGTGDLMEHSAPVPVSGGLRFTWISAGVIQTCAVTAANQAYCWGNSYGGELGNPSTPQTVTQPTAVGGGLLFQQVYSGLLYSCGLTVRGVAYCWGDNSAASSETVPLPRAIRRSPSPADSPGCRWPPTPARRSSRARRLLPTPAASRRQCARTAGGTPIAVPSAQWPPLARAPVILARSRAAPFRSPSPVIRATPRSPSDWRTLVESQSTAPPTAGDRTTTVNSATALPRGGRLQYPWRET